ncbi:MAG: hypothetical protein K8S99_16440 [Planctomycetes bacterium]|nr:hypothetical protein [Planctomycetota bacterium]
MFRTMILAAASTPPMDERQARLEQVTRGFRHQPWGATEMIFVAILVLIVLMAYVLYRWQRERRQRSTPMLTFHYAAEQMGLEMRDELLLARIARVQELPSPLTLMLSRGTLRHHTARYLKTLSPGQAARINRRIEGVERLLFESNAGVRQAV